MKKGILILCMVLVSVMASAQNNKKTVVTPTKVVCCEKCKAADCKNCKKINCDNANCKNCKKANCDKSNCKNCTQKNCGKADCNKYCDKVRCTGNLQKCNKKTK